MDLMPSKLQSKFRTNYGHYIFLSEIHLQMNIHPYCTFTQTHIEMLFCYSTSYIFYRNRLMKTKGRYKYISFICFFGCTSIEIVTTPLSLTPDCIYYKLAWDPIFRGRPLYACFPKRYLTDKFWYTAQHHHPYHTGGQKVQICFQFTLKGFRL